MFHTVYKTTNLANGKYYFGYHKTKNPQDAYLGSGKYLRNAIAKHGASNFKKEVLFVYPDAISAFGKEAEMVGVFRNDLLCMNLRQGGAGGFDWINANKSNRAELTGQRFGNLFVLGFAGVTLKHSVVWHVRCDCGREKTIMTQDLRSGAVRACGTCWKADNLTGKRFGKLVVLKRDGGFGTHFGSRSGAIWHVRCDCGQEKSVKAQSLKNGNAKSCGCSHPKRPKVSVGQRFGRLTVKARVDNTWDKRSMWLAVCDCGNTCEVLGSSIKAGATKSCGCLRKETTATLKARSAGQGR